MTKQHIPVTGGCRCGAIRYESVKAPADGGYCHCEDCRRAWGGLFSAWVLFNRSDFQFTQGEPKYYRSTESDFTQRGFCGECGTPLIHTYDGTSYFVLPIGTLDYPNEWPLSIDGWTGHVFVDSKIEWYDIADSLPQYARSAGYYDSAEFDSEQG